MRKILFLGYLLIFITTLSFAQSRVVSGTVADENGESLPGVNVVLKGTTTGTITDASGKYSLNVPEAGGTLVFSYVGLQTKEQEIGASSTLDVTMAADLRSLNEVVVTGYTTQQRKEITGAVSTLAAKDLVAIPQGNVEQQLQGRISGVTVITSGQPGTGSQVRIRGFGSFSGNGPLYIVDGVPTEDVSWLNSNDIETTTVLKDAATASIYGARAASGVIVYTTKRGKSGKVNLSYDGSYGTQVPGKGFDLLNPTQHAQATWTALGNAGKPLVHDQYGTGATPTLPDYILAGSKFGPTITAADVDPSLYNNNFDKGPIYQIVSANKSGTDWFDELTDPAPIQTHNLGLSGGSEGANYYIGLGVYDQQGIVLNTDYKRYTLRANTQFNIKNRVRIGENVQLGYRQQQGFNNLSEGNPIALAYRMNPLIPVYDDFGGFAGTAAKGFNNPSNPVANQARAANNKGFAINGFGNVFAEVDLIKGLTLKTSIGGGLGTSYGNGMTHRTYENSENIGAYTVFEGANYGAEWAFTNTATYTVEFGGSKLNLLAGTEAIHSGIGRGINGSGQNPFSINPDYVTLGTTSSGGRAVTSGGNPGSKYFSVFGKVDYSLNQKYLASLVLRKDGSSSFGPEERTGYFPAVSAGWRVGQEGFMQTIPFVTDLKIRGGFGIMGNSRNVPLSNQFNTYGTNPGIYSYSINGSNTGIASGIAQRQVGNPFGRWETAQTFNIGFDGSFLNGTLDIIFDYYTKETSDLLFAPELPAVLGQIISPIVNIASMSNSGVDLQIIKKGTIGSDFRYEGDVTFTTYKNEITKIAEGVDYFDGNSFGSGRVGTFTRNAVGQSMSAFYGYEVAGLFADAGDVAGSPTQQDAAPGRFKYKDVNGDGAITTDDRTFFGNPNPDFTYGLTLKLGFKGLDLETTFYGVQGADIINYTRWFTDFYPSFPGQALSTRVLDAWTPTNTGATTPILEDASNFSTNGVANSYYMENGSYLRNRNLQLSYTLPTSAVSKFGAERLKIFVQGTNLFTMSPYSGLDPGVSGVDTNFGVDYGNYPVVKNFILGVNLGF